MNKELGPNQLNVLVSNPAVNEEFSQKIRELDRRLQANGMSYRDWDTLNDRQHEIFSHDMFLDGECATSPEHYVKGAVNSCGCPDTEEDLHHHSPVLMREIEKQQEMLPDMTVKISESLGFLNEMIDQQVDKLITEGPASAKIIKYEQDIIDSLSAAGIVGNILVADANSNGPDGQFIIDGKPYDLEVKENTNAQMGGGTVRYYPGNPDGERFRLANPEKMDEQGWVATRAILKEKEDDILAWVTALIDPARPASSKWRNEDGTFVPGKTALGFQTTYRKYQDAKKSGLQNKASAGFGKLPLRKAPPGFIDKMYSFEKIYYIQVGGKGLYYMGANPANLPVPHFDGEITVELRPRPAGREGTTDQETGEKIYKTWSSPSDPEDKVIHYGGSYGVTPRFRSKDVAPSPYTLDEVGGPRGIKAMLATMSQQPQEDPAEPEGLEVEPEESEET